MDISELIQGAAGDAAPQRAPEAPALGREDFLGMLIAQLENQDPLNPQDSTEFTAQLAQFSSLEQLISMRTSIDALASGQSNSEALAATGLIGREALVASSSFGVSEDPERPLPTLHLEAVSPTPVLGVEVRNHVGAVVARNSSIGTLGLGRTELDWSDFDNTPGPGTYSVRVLTEPGKTSPGVAIRSRVTGATLDGAPNLMIDGAKVPLAALLEVRE